MQLKQHLNAIYSKDTGPLKLKKTACTTYCYQYLTHLKLSQVDIQRTIKTERSCDGGHNLTNQSVQVGVSWPLNVQVAAADIIDGLVVNHEGTVRVLQGGVSGENGVVRLNNSCCNLWRWVD